MGIVPPVESADPQRSRCCNEARGAAFWTAWYLPAIPPSRPIRTRATASHGPAFDRAVAAATSVPGGQKTPSPHSRRAREATRRREFGWGVVEEGRIPYGIFLMMAANSAGVNAFKVFIRTNP